MKYFLSILFFLVAFSVEAQKFALLDEQFAVPVKYSDKISVSDKFSDIFPIEKDKLPDFLKILKEIELALTSKEPNVQQYEVGCVKFKGRKISLASGPRIDYVITSGCDNVKTVLHLCDANASNKRNAFFVQTWIKYIESYMK